MFQHPHNKVSTKGSLPFATYDDEKTTPYNIYQSEAVTKIATNIDTMAVDLQKKSFGNPACSSYSTLAKISEQFF